MSILKKRRIDYLTDQQFKDLKKNDPQTFKTYKQHRDLYELVRRREEMLKNREKKTDLLKEELKEMKKDLTFTYADLQSLNEDFEFKCKLRKLRNSFELKIYRSSKNPLSVHLGTRKKLIEVLSSLFPKEDVKRNWYFILKRESYCYFDKDKKRFVDGMIYANILDLMMKNPTGFHKQTITRDDVLRPV